MVANRDSMVASRDSYKESRDALKEDVDRYDGYRLLVFNVFMILPLLLSFCGVLSCITEKGWGSMVMGLSLFPLCAVFFLVGAVQMPVATFFADHCYDTQDYMQFQLHNKTYPAPVFFNVSDLNMSEWFTHFTSCNSTRPELMRKMDNPEQLMADNNLNLSGTVASTKQVPDGFALHPTMEAYVEDIFEVWELSLAQFGTIGRKFNCERTKPLYNNLFELACSEFAPQFALSTGAYVFLAILMIPLIIIGVKGHKRYNALNHVLTFEMEHGHHHRAPPPGNRKPAGGGEGRGGGGRGGEGVATRNRQHVPIAHSVVPIAAFGHAGPADLSY
jgi:hypothetical protein